MQPRWYQRDAVNALFTYFQNNKGNPLIGLPTGTGKSYVIALFLQSVYRLYPNQRIMMLTHVKELIDQNFKELKKCWPQAPAGIYSAGLNKRDHDNPITFAGIQSVFRRSNLFGHIDLVIIDESHLVGEKQNGMYLSFMEELRKVNPYLKVIGLTATPYRAKTGILTDGGLFDAFAFDLTSMEGFNRLLDEGYLCPLVPKKTKTEYDLTGIRITAGDYNSKDLEERVDQEDLTRAIVSEMMQYREDRNSWLVFASGVDHAEHVTAEIKSHGVTAECVHSKMKGNRDRILEAAKLGKIQALVNYGVLTTGFNNPRTDMIAMLRATRSPGLWVQMLGRGTRPCPEVGKENCLVLDFGGNTLRLGPINDPVIPRKKGEGGRPGTTPVRVCPKCQTYCHTVVKTCPECGFEFPVNQPLQYHASDAELIRKKAVMVEEFKVTDMNFVRHKKVGKPDSVKVNYHCGLRRFVSWLCFEHDGFARHSARQWWIDNQQSADRIPETTDEALSRVKEVRTPAKIKVLLTSQYPEIVAYEY